MIARQDKTHVQFTMTHGEYYAMNALAGLVLGIVIGVAHEFGKYSEKKRVVNSVIRFLAEAGKNVSESKGN